MLHWGAGRRFVRWAPSGTPALDADAVTLIAAMTVPPDATRQTLISNTFTALKTPTNVLAKLGLLFVSAAHDVQAGKLNWVNPAFAPLVASNSPTFTTDRGFQGDAATSGLATTGVNITVVPGFAQDNASMFAWSLTDGQSANSDFGTQGGSSTFFIIRSTTNMLQSKFNSATTGQTANSGGIGFFGASRSLAATADHYKDGALIGSPAAVSSAVVALPFSVCRGQASFSIRQIAAASAGSALNSTEEAALYNALHTYLQAVGASA